MSTGPAPIPSLPTFADDQMLPIGYIASVAFILFITAIGIIMKARDIKVGFMLLSASSILVYALFTVLAWKDMAEQAMMVMTDAAYLMPAATWSAMPSVVFSSPLFFASFFMACAMYKNFKDHQK